MKELVALHEFRVGYLDRVSAGRQLGPLFNLRLENRNVTIAGQPGGTNVLNGASSFYCSSIYMFSGG